MRTDTAGLGIAVLGWGSLIWDPGTLHVATPWELAEIRLPLEFSRISKRQRRLTLVIDTANGVDCCVYYAHSSFASLKDAVADLAEREETAIENVGVAQASDAQEDPRRRIESWRIRRGLRAVIWTDLDPNFPKKRKKAFSIPEALAHLAEISPEEREAAHRYIANAPVCVRTPLRQKLIDDGWL